MADENGIKRVENLRDALIGAFERYDGLTDEYTEVCAQLRCTVGEDWFDPDKNCTPLEHALYCICEMIGFDGRELYAVARNNIQVGIHTSFAKPKE